MIPINDYIELRLFIENLSDASVSVTYTIIGPSGIEQGTTMKGRNFIKVNSKIDGKLFRKARIRGQ